MMSKHARGVSTMAVIAVLVIAALGYMGWTSYQKSQARAAHEAAVIAANTSMDKSRAQWLDAMRLATNTPRIGLAGPIASLQSIRQGVQAIEVPACLSPNKEHLIQGMNEALEGMLAFMRNDMGKFELEDFTAQKAKAMASSFEEYDKKPVPCLPKK